jgi:hypothetical protein
MFDTTVARLGLNRSGRYRAPDEATPTDDDAPTTFRRPPPKTGQLTLF